MRRSTALPHARLWSSLVLAFLAVGPNATHGWTTANIDEYEIEIDAEEITFDQAADTFNAAGRVLIRRGSLQLIADEIRISRGTQEAEALGAVELTSPDGFFAADHVYFNLTDETGFLRNVSIQSSESRYSIFGTYAEKRVGQCYRIENGEFTTCRCPKGPPTWTIASETLDLDVGGYGTVRNSTFRLFGRPILYLPWAVFPVSTERQSGLLEPRFAFSNRRGLQILQPVYWAINKSHDATVAVDVETSARLGLVAEHRYALSRATRGTWGFTYFNEAIRGNPDGLSLRSRIPENRWSVNADHTQRDLLGGTFYVDAFIVGDDGFLREINALTTEYSRDVALRTLQYTDSRVGYVRTWERHLLRLEGTYYQDIDLTGIVEAPPGVNEDLLPPPVAAPVEPRSEARTLQRAPSLEWNAQGRLLGPVLGDVHASLVDFQRGRGSDGLRLDIEPSLALPLPLGPYAFGSIQASARETAYHMFERQESPDVRLPRNPTRETFAVGAQVGSTLARVYPVRWRGYDAIQHVVEPRLDYTFVPSVAQDDLPIFDGRDRARARNLFTYGVSSRVMARSGPAEPGAEHGNVREWARFWLLQSVDVERRVPSVAANVDRDDHFSDIDVGGAIHPLEGLSLDFASQLDHSAGELTAARVGIFVEDRRSGRDTRAEIRSRARISYRFLTGNALQEVHGDLTLRLTRWMGFLFATRYDVVANEFFDRHFGIRVLSRCDCWALDFGLTDRRNPQEVEARVRFTLIGLTDSGFLAPGS